MQTRDFQYHMPVRLVIGDGRLSELPQEVAALGQRALIVSYPDSDWTRRNYALLRDLLARQSVEVAGLGEVEPEPDPQRIDQLAAQFAHAGVDVVIGFGGGSVLDAAKGVAVALALGGKTWDYVGRGKVSRPVLPVVAVPTTAGTGSETTPYAIFKNSALNRKAGIISPYIFPRLAILDPQVTVSLPPRITAVSGIDAFAHALESFTSPTRNPMASAAARQSLELIGRSLTTAIQHGEDVEARAAMLIGSSLGGIAIAHAGTGIAHALGATLGGFYPLEHGWAVGLCLPLAIRYNTPVAKELYWQAAQTIGLPVQDMSPGQASERLAQQVDAWLEMAGLNRRLSDLGVRRQTFPAMIEDTSTQNSVGNNIRPVDRAAIQSFYEQLF